MIIEVLDKEFCICQINEINQIDFSDSFLFVGKTNEELSLVCYKESVPEDAIKVEEGYKALRIQGELDLNMVGVIKNISSILADINVPIFVLSTFNTDYILIKNKYLTNVIEELKNHDYLIGEFYA